MSRIPAGEILGQPGAPTIPDDNRLLLSLCMLSRLVQAGLLLYVWRIHRTYRPARDWAIGALITVPGLFLVALREVIPLWASVLPANFVVLAGNVVVDYGVIRAAGRTPPWRFGITLFLASQAVLAWFTLARPDYTMRLTFYQATVIILDLQAAAACLLCENKGLRTTLRLVAGLFILHTISGLWRILGALADHVPTILTPDLSQVQYGIFVVLGVMAMTSLFALLTSQKVQEDLHALAHLDPLTQACNRRSLEVAVADEWNRAVEHDEPVSCLMLDIDHFKLFNDRYGHQAGDAALVAVSETARGLLRAEDTWCRFGGEEFLALLPGTDIRGALAVAERLREKIAALDLSDLASPGELVRLSASIGVAEARNASVSWTELVGRCDRALYLAKKKGRNRVEAATQDTEPILRPSIVRLAWNKIYACGREPIDSQHRQLFSDANDLLTALMTGLPKATCQKRIRTLLDHISNHFEEEEAIFREAGYPDANHHASIHATLVAKAWDIGRRYDRDALTLGEVFDFLAMEVVAQHMLAEDRKFFPYLANGDQQA